MNNLIQNFLNWFLNKQIEIKTLIFICSSLYPCRRSVPRDILTRLFPLFRTGSKYLSLLSLPCNCRPRALNSRAWFLPCPWVYCISSCILLHILVTPRAKLDQEVKVHQRRIFHPCKPWTMETQICNHVDRRHLVSLHS